MSRSTIIGLGGLAAVIAAGAAGADEPHPPYLPTRDVAVTYVLDHSGPGPAKQAHMYYSAADEKLRLEAPNQRGFVIIDRVARTMTVVLQAEHLYVQTPLDPAMASGFVLDGEMRFSRGGSQTIAGQHCTDWQVEGRRGSGTVCVTDDGVLLFGRGQKEGAGGGGFQAIAVSYAPQPASLFTPPPGFRQLDLSQIGGKPK